MLTCNRQGKLTTTFEDDPKVEAITLDEPTNDKSLVMTSSFTKLVLTALSGSGGTSRARSGDLVISRVVQTFALYPPEN